MIFLAPGIVILSQVFGVTGMLWAAPAADVLALGLTVVYWSCRNGIRSVPGRTGRSHRCRKQDRFRRVERRLCFRQVRSDARSEQRRLFRYRDGVFLYAVANQPAQEGSGYLEKRARAFGGCGWLALIGTHTLRGREVRINRRAPCVQGQIRGPLLLRAKVSVRRWPPPTFSAPFFQCAIHKSGKFRTGRRSRAG